MNKVMYTVLAACILVVLAKENGAQPPRGVRLKNELDSQRSRINTERVLRQVEVGRLEQTLEQLDARVRRLERLMMATGRFPAITVMEAEAELALAETTLRASEEAHASGALSAARLAVDRLAAVRARAQLEMAKAAQQDRLIELELDVIHAERQLLNETQRLKGLERTLARGYGSPDRRQLLRLEIDRAQKELDRAKARLQSQQRTAAPGDEATQAE